MWCEFETKMFQPTSSFLRYLHGVLTGAAVLAVSSDVLKKWDSRVGKSWIKSPVVRITVMVKV